jgi:hypothetical protein
MSVKKITLVFATLCLVLFNVGSLFPAEYKSNIQSLVLEDFELGPDAKPKQWWFLNPDRFGRVDSTDAGASLQQLRWVPAWPEKYFGVAKADSKKGEFFYGPIGTENNEDMKKRYTDISGTCLGMNIKFNRQGYNSVELIPIILNKDGKTYDKTSLPFKGNVKQVDMWIWGANYNYYVEMVLRDYRGAEYRLDVGSIRHVGWKNFVIPIPNSLPQNVVYVPGQKPLSLVKLVIWTTPNEKVSGAYVYIDHIKYLTDVASDLYDGYQLGNEDYVKVLNEKAVVQPKDTDVNP